MFICVFMLKIHTYACTCHITYMHIYIYIYIYIYVYIYVHIHTCIHRDAHLKCIHVSLSMWSFEICQTQFGRALDMTRPIALSTWSFEICQTQFGRALDMTRPIAVHGPPGHPRAMGGVRGGQAPLRVGKLSEARDHVCTCPPPPCSE